MEKEEPEQRTQAVWMHPPMCRDCQQMTASSSEGWRALFHNRNIAMLLIDPDTAAIVDANGAAQSFYGYDREDLLRCGIADLNILPPEQIRVELERAQNKRDSRFYFKHRLANGEIRDVEVHCGPIEIDGRRLLYSIIHDDTERRRTEQALRESEERFRLTFDQAPIGAAIASPDHRYLRVNEALCRITGYLAEELKSLTFRDITHPDDLALDIEQSQRLLDGKIDRHAMDKRYLRKDGTIVWIHLTVRLVRGPAGEPSYLLAMMEDISERKRAEQEKERLESDLRQAQKLEAIGTLAGGIAHDFNNILAAILGYTEMALDDIPQQSTAREDLGQVLTAANRARELIAQIQAFGRQSEAGERRPVQLADLVKGSLRFLRATLPTTIQLRQAITSTGRQVLADSVQIQQVIVNLCTNAAHAMRDCGGLLEVRLAEVELDAAAARVSQGLCAGGYMQLVVSDTGCGMNPAILERIFDPYFTTKVTGEGSGLGLAVVHGIVQRHQGAVTVTSEPGRGSTFQILLPTVGTGQEDATGASPRSVGAESQRILYVDDEEALAALGKRMLTQLGYEVVATSSSGEALELFCAQPDSFDLIITDYTMPHLTGVDLAVEALRIRPDIPIILCTGYSESITDGKARRLGIRRLVMKPLSRQNLAEVVWNVLEQ